MKRNTSILVLDSRYRYNKEDNSGYEYKFKLNRTLKLSGNVKLEQFVFQNSQYTFSSENKSNKFIFENITVPSGPIPITITGTFNNIDDFLKAFNDAVNPYNITLSFNKQLYELTLRHSYGYQFKFNEFYDNGGFMNMIGFNKINEGSTSYTNVNIPKLFSQSLIYITIHEIGLINTFVENSKPYTFAITTQSGFEISYSQNNTFENTFYVDNRETDVLTIQIRNNDGLPFYNDKGDASFILILSY